MSTVSRRTLSDCEKDALELLKRRSVDVEDIVRVNPDSILFLTSQDRPYTAWVYRPPNPGKPVELVIEVGFVAERSKPFASETARAA